AGLCAVLPVVHDLLLARGGLQHNSNRSNVCRAVLQHKTRLREELDRILRREGARSPKELVPEELKDNVNLLKATVESVVAAFEAEGYKLLVAPCQLRPRARAFMVDEHLPDLLVFPPSADLHDHALYINGSIILQDKASCFPAHVVSPPRGSAAIDACAAPGNKTSHMASIMQNMGTIYAFDMDPRRLELLKSLTTKAGCKTIVPSCQSFLEVNPGDPQYRDVEYLLLDPSCSGSGIINRLDRLVDHFATLVHTGPGRDDSEADRRQRLANLAEFQTQVILHAMKFPSAKRISYSTCSVHREENEEVVARVLAAQSRFTIAPRSEVLPKWPHRGLETPGLSKVMRLLDPARLTSVAASRTLEQADGLIRAAPKDGTNGFFVACFIIDPRAQALHASAQEQPQGRFQEQERQTRRKRSISKVHADKALDEAATISSSNNSDTESGGLQRKIITPAKPPLDTGAKGMPSALESPKRAKRTRKARRKTRPKQVTL
ncbi:hypothetical protein EV182_002986, partial [Spiromyces aspiralis]